MTILMFARFAPRYTGLAFAAAVICLSGCNDRPATVDKVSAASSSVPASPTPATQDRPKPTQGTSESGAFTTTGPLVAEQQADVAAERDGRIVSIAVEIGSRVHKGEVLAMLDDRSLRSACDSQKAKVSSLEAQVREWEAEQKAEEADLKRADAMLAEKIRSQEDWEHVKYKLDETVAEVARYRSDQAAAEADLKFAELQLEKSRVVAPFDGVVGRNPVRVAQEVKQGDVLFWVTAEAPLRVLFTVPESSMAAFSTGASLELTTAVYPLLRQPAKILRVSPVVDPASGSVQVVGAVVHPSPLLKPGMTMQVRLTP